jgi:transcriptional regulator with XRE-family HTH domain
MRDSSLSELLGIDPEDPVAHLAADLVRGDMDLVARLIQLRHDRGLTQQQVADLLGISQAAVAGFERAGGDPHLSTIRRYAMAVRARVVHTVAPVDDCESLAPQPRTEEHVQAVFAEMLNRKAEDEPSRLKIRPPSKHAPAVDPWLADA